MKASAILLVCVLACGTAQAQRVSIVSAKVLMSACSGSKQADLCDAYLDGFTDAIHANGQNHAIACIPQNVTGTELRDVVAHWLRDNPQAQHDTGEKVTRLSLQKAYPCKK
jgi:hypothetical protein